VIDQVIDYLIDHFNHLAIIRANC